MEEYRSIKKAVYMRNIACKFHPVKYMEYRLIPLLMSIINIGNELTIVAVARGFGSDGKKTSTCVVRLTILDYLLITILITLGITGAVVAIKF
jgi:energy-coupling factor transport system permease protein